MLVDPTSAIFAGTPPSGDERVDSDDDDLFDHEEAPAGRSASPSRTEAHAPPGHRNPSVADTDDDGLDDFTEKSLVIDPRDDDTDDDGLTDYVEFNEVFSDPAMQDTDADTSPTAWSTRSSAPRPSWPTPTATSSPTATRSTSPSATPGSQICPSRRWRSAR